MLGKTISRYRILEPLGAGGMGEVYRARDERLDRDVALKVLPTGRFSDEIARKRFRKEALALSRLNHPNIAAVYDFDTEEGVDFVVMELVSGETLAERLAAGPLTEKEAIAVGLQVAAALEEAHERGVVHRDLKPGNIMLTAKGQVKVLDFGLARVFEPGSDPELTASVTEHTATGTLPYMSPEQLRGEQVDARSDMWSAGAVLYEMLAGQRPFPETHGTRLIDSILHQPPQPLREVNPRLSPGLESIIRKTLEKVPAHRYQSAKELIADFQQLSASLPLLSAVERKKPRPWKPLGAVFAGLLLVLGGWVAIHTWRSGAPGEGHPSVLIGDFENRTGEPVFDLTLRELLTTTLEQSRYLNVFPRGRTAEVLRRMELPPNLPIDETAGREICQREGLEALLLGAISRLGTSYVVAARAVDPAGNTLASAQELVQEASAVPPALDLLAQKLRTGLGESLASVEKSSLPLAQVTSKSLDAIRYFTLGKQSLYGGDPQEAIVLFGKAVELDSGFAMAHAYLGAAYTSSNDWGRAEHELHQASLLVHKVTEAEKLKILGDYNLVGGRYDEAVGYYQVLSQLRPQDPAPYINLGLCFARRFDFDSAIAATEKAVQVEPFPRPRINLAEHHLMKGNTKKALEIAQEVLHELPDDIEALALFGNSQLLLGQLSEARATFEQLVRSGGDKETEGRARLADLALARGRTREARSHLEAGLVAAEKRGNRFVALKYRIVLAELSLREGASLRYARALSALDVPTDDPALIFLAGRVYARGRRLAEARRLLQRMETLLDSKQTATLQSLQHLLRAEVALAEGTSPSAIEAAENAVRYENSTLALEALAHSYASAERNPEAIREYERVLARASERSASYDGPGFHRVVEIHYRLGLLYQKQAQAEPARQHLQIFLQYWSQPEAELEPYRDAKERLRELDAVAPGVRGQPTPAT